MREFKFRAWNTMVCRMTDFDFKDIESQSDPIQWHIIKIMQWTGKLDKNNKLVYEGDVVHYAFDYDDEKLKKKANRYTGVIEWCKENCEFVIQPLRICFNTQNFLFVEVIGNIFENSDLARKEAI